VAKPSMQCACSRKRVVSAGAIQPGVQPEASTALSTSALERHDRTYEGYIHARWIPELDKQTQRAPRTQSPSWGPHHQRLEWFHRAVEAQRRDAARAPTAACVEPLVDVRRQQLAQHTPHHLPVCELSLPQVGNTRLSSKGPIEYGRVVHAPAARGIWCRLGAGRRGTRTAPPTPPPPAAPPPPASPASDSDSFLSGWSGKATRHASRFCSCCWAAETPAETAVCQTLARYSSAAALPRSDVRGTHQNKPCGRAGQGRPVRDVPRALELVHDAHIERQQQRT
jgi:hypothetical protein